MDFVKYFKEKAKSDIQRIVLAEGTEERTLKAADIVLGEGFADLIILSKTEFIKKFAADNNLQNLCKATIIDPENNPKAEEYANLMERLAEAKEAEVVVEGTAYPGTTVNIGELSMIVKKPVQYSKFVVREGDVRLAPI